MNNYVHYDGREYRISKNANTVINAISKDYSIKLELDQEEEGSDRTHIWIHIFIGEKEKYRLGLLDIIFQDKLYFNGCHNYFLEEEYSKKFNKDDFYINTGMKNDHFYIEITRLDDNDDDLEEVTIDVKDKFPEYLRQFTEIDFN